MCVMYSGNISFGICRQPTICANVSTEEHHGKKLLRGRRIMVLGAHVRVCVCLNEGNRGEERRKVKSSGKSRATAKCN